MKAITAALFAILLAACGTQQAAAPARPTTAHASTGLPNPASVSCQKQGGKLDLRPDAAGNVSGICVFKDGRQCEEWALFRDNQCVMPDKKP